MKLNALLIANRGEIALRIIRSARRLGLRTIAVYSDADAHAPHVTAADRAVRLGPAPANESYLSIERVLAAAKASGADAIHPGYGFLSERADFARAVAEAGLLLIGPTATSIEQMGDKSAAKAIAIAAGVPCLPGFGGRGEGEQSAERLGREGRALGFPLMIKAAAGGGGRGMRLVEHEASLDAALIAARAEAQAAFGDGTLLLERAVLSGRHIEVQIFADAHGHVVHLGERDCSVQRRNQKVVEESPSPALDPSLRAQMAEAALRLVREIGYLGAGTVEFLFSDSGEFFFLEMNTRLQVEHPVTELCHDLDLVEWQLRVARGEPLPLDQAAIDARRRGHAIEVRLCAEDSEFRPQTGRVLALALPSGEGVRVDAALTLGLDVGADYDSMLGKLIAYGADREQARARLLRALFELQILGVTTNRDLLRRVLASDTFARGAATTAFFSVQEPGLSSATPPPWHAALAAIALELDDGAALALPPELRGWQSAQLDPRPRKLMDSTQLHTLKLKRRGARFSVTHGEAHLELELLAARGGELEIHRRWASQPDVLANTLEFVHDGLRLSARYVRAGAVLWLDAEGCCERYEEQSERALVSAQGGSGQVRAKVDGKVVRVLASAGEPVRQGQVLIVLESMKMEFELRAGADGVLRTLTASTGQQVKSGQVLGVVTADEA